MPAPLPKFEAAKVYLLPGRTLNEIMLAIEERTALAGAGITIDYLAAGQRIHALPQKCPDVTIGSGSGGSPHSLSESGSKDSGGGGGGSEPSSSTKDSSHQTSTRDHSDSKSNSDSKSHSGSGPGSGSKFAIVPITQAGAVCWIGWQCVERPQAIFRDVVEISLDKLTGRGSREIEREHVLSVEPGSLRITSVLAVDAPASLMHTLDQDDDGAVIHLQTPRRSRRPTLARVTIEGVRRGHGARWPRFTAEEALANHNFLRSAIGLPPLDSYPQP